MKYKVKFTSQFKKDLKLAQKRGYDIEKLNKVVKMIASGENIEELVRLYDDHELHGNWKNHRELHIQSDWLLIYELYDDVLVLSLSRTGTHSDLFNK